jgi:hypothetical protein
VKVEVAQIIVALVSYTSGHLLCPLDGGQRSTDARDGDEHIKLVVQEHGHIVSKEPGFLQQMFAKRSKNRWRTQLLSSSAIGWRFRSARQPYVSVYVADRAVRYCNDVECEGTLGHLDFGE